MKKNLLVVLTILMAMFAFADKKGEDIARKYFDLKSPTDTKGEASMTIVDKRKNKKTRKLVMFTKDNEKSGATDSFIRFIEPADVKNTKFLTLGNNEGDDVQRLYLPAMKKIRKISSSSKDGKFVGSDLYYYDMEDKDFEDFTYKFLAENVEIEGKAFAGKKFYKIEQVAKDKAAPYSKGIIYVSMEDYFLYKTEAYDKKDDKLLKEVVVLKTQIIDDIIIPTATLVINVKEDSKTLLQMDNIQINTGLSSDIFTVKNLEE